MLATRIDDCLRSVPTCQLPAASTQQRTERSLNRVDGRRATGDGLCHCHGHGGGPVVTLMTQGSWQQLAGDGTR